MFEITPGICSTHVTPARRCSRTASTEDTRLKRALLIVLAVLPLLLFSACFGFLDRGFRFHGEYEAPHSGFRIEVMARGYVKGGYDIAETAFAVARFCPVHQSAGRSFELSLLAEEGQWIKASCHDFDLNHAEWNWKTADSLLEGLLSKAGFSNVSEEEVKGAVQVLDGSLAGPKGARLKGQIDSLVVLRADTSYEMGVKRGRPSSDWMDESALQLCNR